jgi:small subunit ribosomal protein S20
MPNTKSAAKRLRSDAKKRFSNRVRKSRIKTSETNLLEKIAAGDKAAATDLLNTVFSELDRAANKGAIHPNKASRKKARLQARVQQMA